MRIAILGPMTLAPLRQHFPDLTAEDVCQIPGMGGHGLMTLVLHRLVRNEWTHLVTFDPRVGRGVREWATETSRLTVLPRRTQGIRRDLYRQERSLLAEALRHGQPDVVHANWTYEYSAGALEAFGPDRVVVTVRDHAADMLRHLGWRYFPDFWLTQRVFRAARWATAVSPYVQTYAVARSSADVRVIPNAVALQALENPLFQHTGDSPVIVWTGSWSRLKNPRVALHAFAMLRSKWPRSVLHMCGAGLEAGGSGEQWCRRHGLDDGVVFQGKLPHPGFLALLGGATLYLHTSLSEACNTAVAESMVRGVPVVGGRESGGIPWQLDQGKAGILVDVRSPEHVASSLGDLLRDEVLRKEISCRGMEYARGLHDPDHVSQQYTALYSQMTGMTT